MVSISLYRGDLHRVPASGRPRKWLLPPRAVSLHQFKILLQKRSLALSRFVSETVQAIKKEEEEEKKEKEKEEGEGREEVPQLDCQTSGCTPVVKSEEQEETATGSDHQVQEPEKTEDVSASNFVEKETADGKFETSNDSSSANGKEMRKRELESKLQVLNEKKHNLVQLLKQILNAEEEIKRRNMQSSGICASAPLQPETAVELGSSTSVTRLPPKLSVEVNFGGDSCRESDVAASSNSTARQLQPTHNTSPSTPSLLRPPLNPFSSLQNSSVLHMSRTSLTAVGVGSAASLTALTSSSPSRFAAPAGVPPFPLTNTHYIASSPSPVASAGASVFRDPNLSSPAPDRNKMPFA